MKKIHNRALERLKKGDLALGVALRQCRTVDIGRILYSADIDWINIDMEHASINLDEAIQIAVAAQDVGITPLVRVPGHEHYHASKVLDGGGMGIIFPHVATAEQASRLVSYCKYPPLGHRSFASNIAQLHFQPLTMTEATALLNGSIMIVIMLETPTAIENAEAIAAVEGVDVAYIGSQDLTLEMGISGQFDHPRFVEAVKKVVTACQKHGKFPGLGGLFDDVLIDRYIQMGIRCLNTGTDISYIISGARARVKKLRSFKR